MPTLEINNAVDMLKELLPAYGYQPIPSDDIMLRMAWQKAQIRVRDFCNIETIPDELQLEVANMAIGEFLYAKKATGKLNVEGDGNGGLVFPHKVTQFTEGDTSLTLTSSGKNNEALFENLINKLRRGDLWVLEHYRRLHW